MAWRLLPAEFTGLTEFHTSLAITQRCEGADEPSTFYNPYLQWRNAIYAKCTFSIAVQFHSCSIKHTVF